MKQTRNLFIGLVLAMNFSVAYAQESTLGIGVKAGVNQNQFNQPGTSVGGNIGGYARFSVNSFLSVQAELLYDVQGGGRAAVFRDPSIIGGTFNGLAVSSIQRINRAVRLNTISLPLSVRLAPTSSSNINLSFVLGGSAEYIIYADEKFDAIYGFENGTTVLLSDRTDPITGDLGRFQAGVHVGAALDFTLDDGRTVTWEMRYRRSLIDINETRTSNAGLTEALNSTTLSFSVFYPILNQ